MTSQTGLFTTESLRYVSENLREDRNRNDIKKLGLLDDLEVSTILDVGCGAGHMLESTTQHFDAQGLGVEPSEEAVDLLRKTHKHNPRLSFSRASIHKLPFENASFDLVYAWSVLHWVGREEYLQALGELLRVTKKYLLVMDFVGGQDYRTEYHHRSNCYTYKMDFEPPLLSSGVLKVLKTARFCEEREENNELTPITKEELSPFEGNSKNYFARKAVLFEKKLDLLPLMEKADFLENS